MSSLVIVKRSEKVGADEPKTGPLFVKDVLLYPNLGEDISKANKEVGFFFTVYPGAAGTKPEAVLELIQNGSRWRRCRCRSTRRMPRGASSRSAGCRSTRSRPGRTS